MGRLYYMNVFQKKTLGLPFYICDNLVRCRPILPIFSRSYTPQVV